MIGITRALTACACVFRPAFAFLPLSISTGGSFALSSLFFMGVGTLKNSAVEFSAGAVVVISARQSGICQY